MYYIGGLEECCRKQRPVEEMIKILLTLLLCFNLPPDYSQKQRDMKWYHFVLEEIAKSYPQPTRDSFATA